MRRVECLAGVVATPDYVGEGRSAPSADGRADGNGRVLAWVRVRRTAEAFILL